MLNPEHAIMATHKLDRRELLWPHPSPSSAVIFCRGALDAHFPPCNPLRKARSPVRPRTRIGSNIARARKIRKMSFCRQPLSQLYCTPKIRLHRNQSTAPPNSYLAMYQAERIYGCCMENSNLNTGGITLFKKHFLTV